jgi:membrane protein involved in colicin uptake
MITKDGRDTPILELTPDNYLVPQGEERQYHCRIECKKFNQDTGERLSKPRVQKFGKKMFETHVMSSLRKQGFTVDILHNPNDWEKEQRAQAAANAKAQAEAKEKAEQARIDAAVAAALAKERAKNADKGEVEAKKPGRPAKDKE